MRPSRCRRFVGQTNLAVSLMDCKTIYLQWLPHAAEALPANLVAQRFCPLVQLFNFGAHLKTTRNMSEAGQIFRRLVATGGSRGFHAGRDQRFDRVSQRHRCCQEGEWTRSRVAVSADLPLGAVRPSRAGEDQTIVRPPVSWRPHCRFAGSAVWRLFQFLWMIISISW
jgi:hypothetical protein